MGETTEPFSPRVRNLIEQVEMMIIKNQQQKRQPHPDLGVSLGKPALARCSPKALTGHRF
jgi:hypothetical protein